jgi:hypothetical protein
MLSATTDQGRSPFECDDLSTSALPLGFLFFKRTFAGIISVVGGLCQEHVAAHVYIPVETFVVPIETVVVPMPCSQVTYHKSG